MLITTDLTAPLRKSHIKLTLFCFVHCQYKKELREGPESQHGCTSLCTQWLLSLIYRDANVCSSSSYFNVF